MFCLSGITADVIQSLQKRHFQVWLAYTKHPVSFIRFTTSLIVLMTISITCTSHHCLHELLSCYVPRLESLRLLAEYRMLLLVGYKKTSLIENTG